MSTLRIKEVADELGVSTGQVHALIQHGHLQALNVGRGQLRASWRVPRESLDAYKAAVLSEARKRFGGAA